MTWNSATLLFAGPLGSSSRRRRGGSVSFSTPAAMLNALACAGAFLSIVKELRMDPNQRPDDMVRITTPELAQAFIDE